MTGMKRKAIQLANNTLVVSLPAKWAKQNNIAKGAELDIGIKERMRIISKGAEAASEEHKVKLDISGMSESLLWSYLNAVYRAGYSEIEIYFSDQRIKNIKTGRVNKTMDTISRVTDRLIGMEIISQSRNSCVLKEVTKMKGDEFRNMLNRIFLSLRTISHDVLSSIKNHDEDTLENIYMYSETNVNKLSDYCMRILNLQGLKDFRQTNLNYLMVFLLEEIGDAYAQIARDGSDFMSGFSREVLSILKRTNDLVEISHKLVLNPKKEYYVLFHEQRNSIKRSIHSLENSKKKSGTGILFLIKGILDKLMELNSAKVCAVGII